MSPTTWELMKKYNVPAPGSFFIPKSHLDSYITIGRVYKAGWNGRNLDMYCSSDFGGVNISIRQFQTCDWEYAYSQVPILDKPHLKWPKAE